MDPNDESSPLSHTKGRPCTVCGSTNTGRDFLSQPRPSILFVMFFGWIFLLIRGAFSHRTDHCKDCGAFNRYKSNGSLFALAVLIVLVLGAVLAKD
jgi:hypothetical protein